MKKILLLWAVAGSLFFALEHYNESPVRAAPGQPVAGTSSTACMNGQKCTPSQISMSGISAPANCASGTGLIYFDSGANQWKICANNGGYFTIANGALTSVSGTPSAGQIAIWASGSAIYGTSFVGSISSATFSGIAAPANSASGAAALYFDSSGNRLKVSENAGNYANVVNESAVTNFKSLTDTVTASTHTLSGTVVCGNFPCTLITLSPGDVGANYISIAGLPSNQHLQIECSSCTWLTGTGLGWRAQFNGDAGTNYAYESFETATGGIGVACESSAGAAFCNLNCITSGGVNAGQTADFTFDFWTTTNGGAAGHSPMGAVDARIYNNSVTRYQREYNFCTYLALNTAINQVTLYNSAAPATNLHIGTLKVRIIP